MVEILLSYAILLYVGLVSDAEYKENLDAHFLKHPDNTLLLELEWRTLDIQGTIKIIFDYCLENNVDYDTFGCFLISKLEEIYYRGDMDIRSFGSKMNSIWRVLPSQIQKKNHFGLCAMRMTLCRGEMKGKQENFIKRCFSIINNDKFQFVRNFKLLIMFKQSLLRQFERLIIYTISI